MFHDTVHKSPMWEAIAQRVSTLLEETEDPVILDLASGHGEPACSIALRIPSASITSSDVDEGLLASARARVEKLALGGRVKVKRLDMTDLSSIRTASIDVVTACLALHLLPRVPSFLREMTRVLKPGGHCIATMWDAVPMVSAKPCRDLQTQTQTPSPTLTLTRSVLAWRRWRP